MFLSKVFANLIFQSLVTYGFAKATIEDPKMSKAVAENALTYMVAWFVALLMFAFTKNIITRFMLSQLCPPSRVCSWVRGVRET